MSATPHVSRGLTNLFAAYSRGHLRRRFHGLRILKSALPPSESPHPLVVYLNHAAWWDPLVCLLLARKFFPHRTAFAPIDAAMLARYRFFSRLGFFGVEQGTTRGGLAFMRTAQAILTSPANALWLTPQGRFVDVRERPLRLQKGLGALATRSPNGAFIPLAIEYAFWTEPRPEILIAFGDLIVPATGRPAGEWTNVLAAALAQAQEQLAAHSCRREPTEWLVLNRGKSGVNAIYDGWCSLRARLRGLPFARDHHPQLSR
jgi:1-acyl-sn-glycerol-3-phosphate acyltransferase